MKIFLVGLGIAVGLLLVANAFMSWRVESQFAAQVAAIRAEGDPASIAELKPPPIPDAENAAAHIDRLTPRLKEFDKDNAAFYRTPVGKEYQALETGESPTVEQIAAIRAILEKRADLEKMISAAAACKRYASTADFSLGFHKYLDAELPRIGRVRTMARFLDWRMKVLISDGQREEAVRRGLEILRLAELSEAEPSLVSNMVSNAVSNTAIHGVYDAIAAGPIPAELHESLDRELAAQEEPGEFEQVLRTERALSVSASLEQSSGSNSGMNPTLASLFRWASLWHFIGPFEWYEKALPIVGRPWHEIKPELAPGGALTTPTGHGVLADLLAPSVEAAIKASNRNTVLIRSLRIVNSLRAYAEANGREASGLADVELPDEATIDPFSGQPLVVKHIDDGWQVYSVGEDGVDNGGSFKDLKDYGLGPPAP